MEIDIGGRKYSYSDTDLDRQEGQVIETFRASSQQPYPDPTAWLDAEPLPANVLLTTVDRVINWSRTGHATGRSGR